MAKTSKQFKKFASSGKLKETIKNRRSHQQSKRKYDEKVTNRKKQRGGPRDEGADDENEEDEEAQAGARDMRKTNVAGRAGGVAKTVDDLFAGFGGSQDGLSADDDEEEDEDDLSVLGDDVEDLDNVEAEDDEDLERDEEAMKKAMKDLEKKDPEFFKYLQENDRNLLDFEADEAEADEDEEEDEDMEEDAEEDEEMASGSEDDELEETKKVVVTSKMLRQWQESLLRLHSINSLRNVLLAFRSAAHMNEEEAQGAGGTRFAINSPQVFNKLVITALKFTPVVIQHHIPAKTLANGRFKVAQPKTPNARLNRLILSHFSTLLYFIRSLPSRPASEDDQEGATALLLMAIGESSKLAPWILSARKHVKAYLKVLLELWSTAADNVRIASFLAVRKMFMGGDDAIKDLCLKGIYRALLGPLRNTTPHTFPSINLLKNTASELYLLSPSLAYPHAFTAIRMLAIHLRDCIRGVTSAPSSKTHGRGEDGEDSGKGKGKKKDTSGPDAFRKVYNWQFVHCIDFWCKTLGAACSSEKVREREGVRSELEPLVYPLVQITLGVVRLFPNSRYFPLHLHLLHSLLHLTRQTGIYIPLTPYLLSILSSAEFRSSRLKPSTLKPLDFEYIIRAPQAYPKTRIYQETLAEELVYLLAEYHAVLATNVAFPEVSLPVVMTVRKLIKKDQAGSAKCQQGLKVLVEKIELSRKWVEDKRRNVSFAPRDRAEVNRFCEGVDVLSTPLGSWVKVQRKVRERKRGEVERALRGERDD